MKVRELIDLLLDVENMIEDGENLEVWHVSSGGTYDTVDEVNTQDDFANKLAREKVVVIF